MSIQFHDACRWHRQWSKILSHAHTHTCGPAPGAANSNAWQVSKWNQATQRNKIKEKTAPGTSKDSREGKRARLSSYQCGDVDEAVMAEFRRLRGLKRRVGKRWLVRRFKKELKERHPDAKEFKASGSWTFRFYRRNRLGLKKTSNNHKTNWAEREPEIRRWLAQTQRRVANSGATKANPWGLYPKVLRVNFDSIPAEFMARNSRHLVEDSDQRGQVFSGKGDADTKRMATIHPAVFNLPKGHAHLQPPPCIIFRGLGGKYYEKERTGKGFSKDGGFDYSRGYCPRVHALHQKKAWLDRQTALRWATKTFIPARVKIGRFFKVAANARSLAFCDNLDAQTHDGFKAALKAPPLNRTDVHTLCKNMTDDMQLIDDGFGKDLKYEMHEALFEFHEGMENDYDPSKQTAAERRIMLTWALDKAWRVTLAKFEDNGEDSNQTKIEHMFDRLGGTINADGPQAELSFQSLRQHNKSLKAQGNPEVTCTYTLSDAGTEHSDEDSNGDSSGCSDDDDLDEPLGPVNPGSPTTAAASDADSEDARLMDLLGANETEEIDYVDYEERDLPDDVREDNTLLAEFMAPHDLGDVGGTEQEDDDYLARPKWGRYQDAKEAKKYKILVDEAADKDNEHRRRMRTGDGVAHVWDESGWHVGEVMAIIDTKKDGATTTKFWIRFGRGTSQYGCECNDEDYGRVWLRVSKHKKAKKRTRR